MPSGDATAGGIIGCTLILWWPKDNRWVAWLMGLAVMFLKAAERLALGFHSLGQVTSGISLGVTLALYTEFSPQVWILAGLVTGLTRFRQYMVLADTTIVALVGTLGFSLDTSLDFTKDDPNNILSWYLGGMAVKLFLVAMTLRHFQLCGWRGFSSSLYKLRNSPNHTQLPTSYGALPFEREKSMGSANGDGPGGHEWWRAVDLTFTLSCFVVLFFSMVLVNCLQVYAWAS